VKLDGPARSDSGRAIPYRTGASTEVVETQYANTVDLTIILRVRYELRTIASESMFGNRTSPSVIARIAQRWVGQPPATI